MQGRRVGYAVIAAVNEKLIIVPTEWVTENLQTTAGPHMPLFSISR